MKAFQIFLSLALLCTTSLTPVLRADEASKQAKIEELLTVSRVQDTFQEQQAQVRAMMDQMVLKQAPSLASDPKFQKVKDAVMSDVEAAMSFDTLKPDLIRIYAETYTEQEIDGLVQFYKSPLGQAMLQKLPTITEKTMAIVQEKMQVLLPKIQKRMQDAMTPAGSSTSPQQ